MAKPSGGTNAPPRPRERKLGPDGLEAWHHAVLRSRLLPAEKALLGVISTFDWDNWGDGCTVSANKLAHTLNADRKTYFRLLNGIQRRHPQLITVEARYASDGRLPNRLRINREACLDLPSKLVLNRGASQRPQKGDEGQGQDRDAPRGRNGTHLGTKTVQEVLASKALHEIPATAERRAPGGDAPLVETSTEGTTALSEGPDVPALERSAAASITSSDARTEFLEYLKALDDAAETNSGPRPSTRAVPPSDSVSVGDYDGA